MTNTEHIAKLSPTVGGIVYPLPSLDTDYLGRAARRLSFRNEHNLYYTTCGISGKSIVSMYSPFVSPSLVGEGLGGGHPVYDQKIRRSDAWDAMDYGLVRDRSMSVTAYLSKLNHTIPKANLINLHSENSDYCNICAYNQKWTG